MATKFHLHKSFYAVSPDPFLSEAFGKGSGCARLNISVDHKQSLNITRVVVYIYIKNMLGALNKSLY